MNELEKLFTGRMMATSQVKRHPYANNCIDTTLTAHIVNSQLIAAWLYDKIQDFEHVLDINKIIMRILFHDIEETITTDIPRHIKRFNKETHENIDKLSDFCQSHLFNNEFVNSSFITKCFEDNESKVFIKIVDYLDLVYTAYKKVYIDGDKSFLFIPAYYCIHCYHESNKGERYYDYLYDLIDKSGFNSESKVTINNIINESFLMLKQMYDDNKELCLRINETSHFFEFIHS